jgi:hypothetical protein
MTQTKAEIEKAKKDPRVKMAYDIADTYADPYKFVMYVFPWGQKGTPLAKSPDGPDDWQKDEFRLLTEHVQAGLRAERSGDENWNVPYRSAIASGHGIGKSAMVAWLILWLMSTRAHCKGIVTANTGIQLETKTWSELAKWWKMAIHKDWFVHTATSFYHAQHKDTWRMDAIPWNLERTESFAGLHNEGSAVVTIYDEASAIPDQIWEVSDGAMTDGEPFWFAFGNPTRNSGMFYKCHHTLSHRWHTRQIDSRDVRITNKRYLNELVNDFGEDSDRVRVRVRGMFPRGGSQQYISGETIEGAFERKLQYDYTAECVLFADVARGGGDSSVVGLREGRIVDRNNVWELDERDSMVLAKFIYDKWVKLKPDVVHIDEAGLGGPILDRLKEMGVRPIRGVNGGAQASNPREHKNMRAQMYSNLKEWLETADIPDTGMFRDDLFALQYEVDEKTGNYDLETKKKFKEREGRSCDWSDALAISLAYPVSTRQGRKMLEQNGKAMYAESNYDMFG